MAIRQIKTTEGLTATVRIEFDTTRFKSRLLRLTKRMQGRVVVQAIRHAIAPVRTQAKAEARRIARQSPTREGTGAMARSIVSEARLSRRYRNKAVALVGPRRGYEEMHFRNAKKGQSVDIDRHGRRFYKDVSNTSAVKRRKLRAVKGLRKGAPISLQRQLNGTTPKRGRLMKRIPSKYAHLLERGTVYSEPLPFLSLALQKRRKEAMSRFVKRLNALIVKEVAKNPGRKAGVHGRR